jgi:protein-S-isoprenylcysteine O-methyltransferase Ste14
MAGYRPDDEWALTDESGNRFDGGWKIIVGFVGIFIALLVIGELGHVPLGILVGISILVGIPALCVWKIVSGLRTGVVSVRRGSYSRAEHPFYYWTLMAMFVGLPVWLFYLLVLVVHHAR